MFLDKCPICNTILTTEYEESDGHEVVTSLHVCEGCDCFKQRNFHGEVTFVIDNRTFTKEDARDMHFFVILKQEQLQSIVQKLDKINERLEHTEEIMITEEDEAEKVWKEIEDERTNVDKFKE